jgi:uncharacterized protein YqeY
VTISEQLTEDMKTSMKAGNAERTGVLRLLRGALKDEEIKRGHTELDEAAALQVLQRQAKQRRDSSEAYKLAGREDLLKQEQFELGIIAEYLPTAMTDEEIGAVVDEVLAAQGEVSMAQMGQVIGAVMAKVGARADGGAVARIVRARLSAR